MGRRGAGSNILRWLGVALATFAATIAMGAVGLPTPELFAALLVGIAYALIAVRRPLDVPSSGTTIAQALIGVALGAALDASTLRAVASNWFGVSAVTLATLAVSLGVGIAIARLTGISQATGTVGLIAGGASGIVAMADELGADSRLVAFMQYVRVLVVVLVAPLVGYLLQAPAESGVPHTEPIGVGLVGDLAFTAGCALAGALVARRLRVTAGALLCPLAVAAILSVSGVAGDASVPALVQSFAFALIGLQVGLRFTLATIREAQALLPWVLGAIFVIIVVSAGLAALLVPLAHVSFADAYLATTPGGLPAVLAASVGLGANTTFVVSVQVLRVFIMVVAAPPLVRHLATLGRRPERLACARARDAKAEHHHDDDPRSMRQRVHSGYELDDDRSRIDRRAVHAFLSHSYMDAQMARRFAQQWYAVWNADDLDAVDASMTAPVDDLGGRCSRCGSIMLPGVPRLPPSMVLLSRRRHVGPRTAAPRGGGCSRYTPAAPGSRPGLPSMAR